MLLRERIAAWLRAPFTALATLWSWVAGATTRAEVRRLRAQLEWTERDLASSQENVRIFSTVVDGLSTSLKEANKTIALYEEQLRVERETAQKVDASKRELEARLEGGVAAGFMAATKKVRQRLAAKKERPKKKRASRSTREHAR